MLTGKTLSHYTVLEKLGAGGMGEVYRAEDSRLNRQVAVKVLPDAFAADQERLARFEREAKLLAALSHPNIAAIYGLEEAEGKRFIILELVEGETLAQRLKKGPLPTDEALHICGQIAEGLEAAHEKGIVHRDLKPANIKIAPDGKVKILDFGLARAFLGQSPASGIVDSPTITAEMTQPGVILGTAAYMSPEQAKGKQVDKRADIWAFGCILFECLAAKSAFPGETITEVLASILKGEPDWEALPKALPGHIRAVLHRCLQKDRNLRYHDIADARIELAEKTELSAAFELKDRDRGFPWIWVGAIAAALLAGAIIGFTLMPSLRPAASRSAIISTIKVEPGLWLDGMRRADLTLQRPSRTAFAISRDGTFVVYSAIEENPGPQDRPRLFMRRMDRPAAAPISGTEGGIHPFLSPDDRWVGFWADRKLKKVPVTGGVPADLCDADSLYGADWGEDDSIVFAKGAERGLSKVSADGGKPEVLTEPDPKREESSHRLPAWLPGGKAVVFTIMRHGWDYQPWLALFRPDTQEWGVLMENAADAEYIPTGHLVFLRQGTLMAVRFDLSGLEVIGQAFPLVDNVMQSFATNSDFNTSAGQFGISRTGSFVYAAGGVVPDSRHSLAWVDQQGKEQPVTDVLAAYIYPRLSPDGQRIAYCNMGRDWQIWVYDLIRGTNSRLTGEGRATIAVWTPDGRKLIFPWRKSAAPHLFWQLYDGSKPKERLTTGERQESLSSSSPDGKKVLFSEPRADSGRDILVLDIPSGQVTPFFNSEYDEVHPEFSPDGRWVAYTSNESKRYEVYVRPFPRPGTKYLVSNEGGNSPLWARDSRRLFYMRGDQVWAADIRTEGGFAAGKPRLLFEKSGYQIAFPNRSYDISLDSQRFLMVKLEQRKPLPVTEMILIQNWFEELKRLVPAKK